MLYAKHGAIRLAYQSYGSTQAVPILLIMGLGMPSISWPPLLIQTLLDNGFRVITFDNRDSGNSTQYPEKVGSFDCLKGVALTLLRRPVPSPYQLKDMAEDALSVLDALDIKKAYVFGISMGSMIAQELALYYPDRLFGIIPAMTASGNPATGVGKLRAIAALLTQPESVNDPQAMVRYLNKTLGVLGAAGHVYDPMFIEKVAKEMVQMNYRIDSPARQLLAILGSGNRTEKIKSIQVPTLVIHGREDPLLPLAAAREVARSIPGATLHIVEGMGHDLPDEKIKEIVEQIVVFVRKR